MDWARIDEPLFVRIVDTILGRIYGERGFAPEGRGGDQGIDYTVDNNDLIFQYKFYPDGVNTSSRRRHLTRSFIDAMQHQPTEWIAVIPARLLKGMRDHILGLSSDIKVTIYDRAWLDNRLIDYPDLGEYFQYRTEIDYLHAKAEALKVNPLFRGPAEVTEKIASLQKAINATDPDWTFDISTENGEIIQTLRAKDANSPTRSPISIAYTAVLPADEAELRRLERNLDYGVVEPIRIAGSMVQDFKITGPELVAYEGPVSALELLPDPDAPRPWVNIDLRVYDDSSNLLGVHLGRSRLKARGPKGVTIEARIGQLLTMLFRVPGIPEESGSADFTTEDFTGHPTHEVLAISRLLTQLRAGRSVDFIVNGNRLMRIILNGLNDLTDRFSETLAIADDLAVIERHTDTRFRFPRGLGWVDRVNIRNARLLLEGNVVAHPTANQIGAKIVGDIDPSLEPLLDPETHGWIKWEGESAQLIVADQIVDVPIIALGGPLRLSDESINAIREAQQGQTDGTPITFQLERDNRLRIWLPDRLNRKVLSITPWELPGIEQPAGTLAALDSEHQHREHDEQESGEA